MEGVPGGPEGGIAVVGGEDGAEDTGIVEYDEDGVSAVAEGGGGELDDVFEVAGLGEGEEVGVGDAVSDGGEVAGPGFEFLRGEGVGLLGRAGFGGWLGEGGGLREGGSDDGEGDGKLEEAEGGFVRFWLVGFGRGAGGDGDRAAATAWAAAGGEAAGGE